MQLTTNYNEICEYKVYTVSDATPRVLYLGVDRMPEIVKFSKVKKLAEFNPSESYTIDILGGYSTREEAMSAAVNMLNDIKPAYSFDKVSKPVRCIELGITYECGRQAAISLGLTHSALYEHLKRKVGFKTVKGLTFEYVEDNK